MFGSIPSLDVLAVKPLLACTYQQMVCWLLWHEFVHLLWGLKAKVAFLNPIICRLALRAREFRETVSKRWKTNIEVGAK